MESTPVAFAALYSITSKCLSLVISSQWQNFSLHFAPSRKFPVQQIAFAQMRAQEVLPEPLVPTNNNEFGILFDFIKFVKVETNTGCPITSFRDWGRYLSASDFFFEVSIVSLGAARPEIYN